MTPTVVIATLLLLAVLCLILGTVRGSYRVWLLGYALVAASLVVVYARIHETQRAPVQAAPQSGARS